MNKQNIETGKKLIVYAFCVVYTHSLNSFRFIDVFTFTAFDELLRLQSFVHYKNFHFRYKRSLGASYDGCLVLNIKKYTRVD